MNTFDSIATVVDAIFKNRLHASEKGNVPNNTRGRIDQTVARKTNIPVNPEAARKYDE